MNQVIEVQHYYSSRKLNQNTIGSNTLSGEEVSMEKSPQKKLNRSKTHETCSSSLHHPDFSSISSSSSPNTLYNNNNSSSMEHNKIKKRKKAVKYETHVFTCNDEPLVASKRKLIAKYDLLRVLHLPQTLASHILGCSFSTLKRRFYESKEELGIEKWPQFYQEVRHLPIFDYIYPMSLTFIMNPVNTKKRASYNDMSPPYISDSEVRNHFLNACMSK